jgi:hypothetical protein
LRQLHNSGQALFPRVDRRAHLVEIGVAVVDRSDTWDGAGNVSVARLVVKDGDAKLPELAAEIGDCPRTKSASIYDGCATRYLRSYDVWTDIVADSRKGAR